jgi:uncharacterized protein (TIGR02271 family)
MNENSPFLPDNLAAAPAPTPLERLAPMPTEGSQVLPIIEERVVVNREVVETGRVRLTRRVHETDEEISVPVQHDEVDVERVPINQTLPAGALPPATRYEGDVLIIPVVREVAVVETRLLVVEELRVTKRQVTTTHTEPVHLRREELIVERLPTTPPPTAEGSGAIS